MFTDFLPPSLNTKFCHILLHLPALQSTRISNRIIVSALQKMPFYTITACNTRTSLIRFSCSPSFSLPLFLSPPRSFSFPFSPLMHVQTHTCLPRAGSNASILNFTLSLFSVFLKNSSLGGNLYLMKQSLLTHSAQGP